MNNLPSMKSTGQLFLSYSRANSEFALRLGSDLRKAGIDIWIDQFDIPPAVHWDEEIQKGLDESKGLLVILSQTSVESDNVLNEINYALETKKQVWPILMEAGIKKPFNINRLQHIDFSISYEAGLKLLISALNGGTKMPFPQKQPAKFSVRRLLLMTPIIILSVYGLFLAYKGMHPERFNENRVKTDTLRNAIPDINGAWTSETITNQFDRADKYTIIFNFKAADSMLTGDMELKATSDGKGYHVKRQFRDGNIKGGYINFYTLEESYTDGKFINFKNFYKGAIEKDSITFSLTSDRPWDFPEQKFVAKK